MAQSHIKLTGGLRDGKSMRNVITQSNHGFVAGQAIRFNREAATGISGDFYTAALANSALNAEVIGIVESTTTNTFDIVYGGEISIAGFDPSFAVSDNDVFFLSGVTAGLLTPNPPSTAGRVIKPVLVRTESNTGVVTNYVGTVIGGSSVVNLDSIQPVGAIEPYAGSATDIPEGWSLCDGGSLSITDFASLYNRVARNYGYNIKFTPSVAGTITSAIQVGMKIQQGQLTGRITEVNAASNYIVVDVDYLKLTTNGFETQDSVVFSNTQETDIPTITNLSQTSFGSIAGTDDVQPTNVIELGLGTFTITHFRKPDLRGKVAIGTAALGKGTVQTADRDFKLGQVGGDFKHQLTEDELASHIHNIDARSFRISIDNVRGSVLQPHNDRESPADPTTELAGGDQPHNNVQPYLGINWIIKTTALASAAVVDSLSIAVPLTGLTDVDITPENGDVPMFDASSTPQKFKPYKLLTNFKSDASSIFQIDTSGNLPKVKVGSPTSANGFSVNLDGVGSGTSKFEVLNSSGTPLLEVQKDSSTSTGVGSIGTGIDTNANLTLGAKGLKFLSSSPVVNQVKDVIADSGSATDTNLVTEKAIRDAISNISLTATSSYTIHLGGAAALPQHELFPSWHTGTRTADTGVKAVLAQGTGGNGQKFLRMTITNNSGADIVIGGHFAVHMLVGGINSSGEETTLSGNFNEQVLKTGNSVSFDSNIFAGTIFQGASTIGKFGVLNFRKATAAETARELGEAHASFLTSGTSTG